MTDDEPNHRKTFLKTLKKEGAPILKDYKLKKLKEDKWINLEINWKKKI